VSDKVFVGSLYGIKPLFDGVRSGGTWRSGKIVLPKQTPFAWIKVVSDATSATPVTVDIRADGKTRLLQFGKLAVYTDVLHTAVFTNNEPQRLPPGRYLEVDITVRSSARVTQVILTGTTEEMKSI